MAESEDLSLDDSSNSKDDVFNPLNWMEDESFSTQQVNNSRGSLDDGLADICDNLALTSLDLIKYNCSRSDGDFEEVEKIVGIVVPIIFGIIVVVGLFGNALVVIVVLFNPQMRSTTNILIINLAIADLLFIVFCVPFTAWDYAFLFWPFGDIWCRIVQYLIVVCALASIYTLVLMSLDRFLAVVHPITSISIRTPRYAYWAIFCVW